MRTQNANNIENPSTGRRMGVNRDFMAYKKTQWLPFPPAVFAETWRPRSSYGLTYGQRVPTAAAIGKRSCHGHWGPDSSPTPKQPRHPPIILVPLEPKWPSGRRDTWQDKRQRSSEGRGALSRLANIVACSTHSLREG